MEGQYGGSTITYIVCTVVSFILGFITEVIFEKSRNVKLTVESYQDCPKEISEDLDIDDEMYGY